MIVDKKMRDEAVLILSICASNDHNIPYITTISFACVWLDIETMGKSATLARYALVDSGTNPPRNYRELCAEAECLLRTGWVP